MRRKTLKQRSISIFMMMAFLLTIVVTAGPAMAASPGDVVISEVRIDQTSTDNDEYFELYGTAGTSLDGLTYLVIGDGDAGSGVIEAVVDLSGQAIPASGYYVAAESTFTLGTADLTASLNFENSDNVTHLLVSGFSGANDDDLDTDDDGVLDVTPWTEVLDLIALVEEENPPSATEYHYGPPSVGPDGSYVPGHAYLCEGGWVVGEFDIAAGDDTPGAANDCVVPLPDVVISEVRIDQTSTDNDEYFELYGTAGTSLDGLTYLVIGDGDAGSGVIEAVVDLSGQAIPASGYYVAAESTFTLGTADLTASLNFENSDNVTHLLVSGFSGANDDDLDTDDDGVLDVTPWTEVLDLIALVEEENPPSATEYHYGPPSVGPDGSYVPGHAYLCEGGWVVGEFDIAAGDDTPGAANDCVVPLPDVVISEIMQNPSAVYDSAGEWLELYNPTGSDIDINGWTIKDNGSDSHVITNSGPFLIPAGGYLVLGVNADTTTNGGVTVAYAYGGSIVLANGDDEVVLLDGGLNEIDRVMYDGGPLFPDPTGASMALKDSLLDNNVGDNWCTAKTAYGDGDLGTPGAANDCLVEVCGDPYTRIYDIQGSGLTSLLTGNEVSIEGVVVGDFQNNGIVDNGDLNGFYVQDPSGDSEAATSDGVFVYAPGSMDVSAGDQVRVQGTVAEYITSDGASSMTEISANQVWQCSSGNSVTPTYLSLPVTAVSDFEAYEGMLVTFPQALVISEYFNFDRFNEIVLTSERHLTPSAEFEPGPDAIQAAQEFLLDKITLDDGRSTQNSDPAIHPNGGVFDLTNLFRGGDTVQNVTGVMDDTFGLYRIQPTQGAVYVSENPRPTQPDDVGDGLKVASFNVLNYFTTLDTIPGSYNGPYICGPNLDLECRGANDAIEFERQRAKIIAALKAIDADVVGLIEIENHPGDVPTADLVSGLNDAMGAGTYDYVATGAIGTDAIRVAFIYKPAAVSLVGNYTVLDASVDARFLDDYNRPALAQTFQDNATGGIFTVAVNHLKSKGSDCDDIGDPDLGDGAGNCNLTRKAAAEALVDWLAGDPTGSGDADFLIIGDLNAYDKEDPIDALVAGGYSDLIHGFLGEYAYSYVFDGQLGYLDHALANPNLLDEVSGVTVWHINADEPDLIDYDMSYKQDAQDALYAPDAYRSSDHDPVVVGLNVCDEIAPTLEVTVSTDTLWPANHKYVKVNTWVKADDNFDKHPRVTLVSVVSNEPDDGLGDGDQAEDIIILSDTSFKLRAERSGTGDGRVYTITYQVTDECGNSSQASVEVYVPHNQ